VHEIIKQIDQLPEADRQLLEQQLVVRAEAEWVRESTSARQLAAQRGIDHAAIDRAVSEVRYGSERAK
jgi:hypothetical protein